MAETSRDGGAATGKDPGGAAGVSASGMRIPSAPPQQERTDAMTFDKAKCATPDLAEVTRKKLLELIPECAGEGGTVDFDKLKQALSSEVIEGNVERYEFTWPGKRKARAAASAPTTKTLRPCREESVDYDTTGNLYIEGDNLEVLKLLQTVYAGKVKMIYIDPPYNTGKDRIYRDKFSLTDEELAQEGDAVDEDGNVFEVNESTAARYHSNWCSMMYPRLKLARNLLRDDGVIFVSIDYNENARMRILLDEVFGNRNFVGEIYWESKTKSQNTEGSFNKLQPKCEMIFVYAKAEKRRFNLVGIGSKTYPFEDERGVYREYSVEVMNADGIRGRETMIYKITDGISTISPPAGKQWQLGQAQVETYKSLGDLFIRDGKAFVKMRPEYERSEKTEPFWGFFDKTMGTAESAKKELTNLIGPHGFETVKPVEILKRLVLHATEHADLVLDFFSGSGTTAHAVMALNAEDGGTRKFIMVQLPEACKEGSAAAKAGFSTICEIGKKRIRHAGITIKEEKILTAPDLDVGFRVLKLGSSSLRDVATTAENADQELANFERVKDDRTAEDLLYQMLLETHIPLSDPIRQETVGGNKVFFVGVEPGEEVSGAPLLACLEGDARMTTEFFLEVAKLKPGLAFFRDSAFADDAARTNLQQAFNQFSPSTKVTVI